MQIEAVRAEHDVARREVVADRRAEDIALQFVGQQDDDDVGLLGASATVSGVKPSLTASWPLAEWAFWATITLQPLSRRFCAWAWPCEP